MGYSQYDQRLRCCSRVLQVKFVAVELLKAQLYERSFCPLILGFACYLLPGISKRQQKGLQAAGTPERERNFLDSLSRSLMSIIYLTSEKNGWKNFP